MLSFEKSLTAAPLVFSVTRSGVGLTGLTATVKLRNAATTNSYLDWADGTFKTSGWTTLSAAMSAVGAGVYQRTVNLAALASVTPGMVLAAEYHGDDGAGTLADAVDLIQVTRVAADASLVRKGLTNSLAETSGSPGRLELLDDDDATSLLAWDLTDESGGAVLPATGTPAQRARATGPGLP